MITNDGRFRDSSVLHLDFESTTDADRRVDCPPHRFLAKFNISTIAWPFGQKQMTDQIGTFESEVEYQRSADSFDSFADGERSTSKIIPIRMRMFSTRTLIETRQTGSNDFRDRLSFPILGISDSHELLANKKMHIACPHLSMKSGSSSLLRVFAMRSKTLGGIVTYTDVYC